MQEGSRVFIPSICTCNMRKKHIQQSLIGCKEKYISLTIWLKMNYVSSVICINIFFNGQESCPVDEKVFCVLTSKSLKPYCQQYSSLLNKFLVSALWLLDCLDAAKVFALNYKKTKYIAFPAGKICFLSFDLFMGK